MGVVVSLALAPLPVRGRERARRSSSPSRSSRGRSRRERSRSSDRYRSRRGSSRSRRDPRIDTGHAVTALDVSGRGLLTAPAVSLRVPLPVGGSGAIVRDRTLP